MFAGLHGRNFEVMYGVKCSCCVCYALRTEKARESEIDGESEINGELRVVKGQMTTPHSIVAYDWHIGLHND